MSPEKRRSSRKPKQQKEIAIQRIELLFSYAEKEFKSHPERAHRYVWLARKTALRFNIRLPREMRRKFCKNCHKYLHPGVNSFVRTRSRQQAVVVTCRECGHVMRFPYRRESITKR